MRKPQGTIIISDPDAGTSEADAFTCFHCQRITVVRAKNDPADLGGFCRVCSRLICSRCVGKSCVPFEKKIQAMEERYYRRRQYEKLAGL